MKGVTKVIRHKSGRRKTVCTTTVLAFFGIAPDTYHYCDSNEDIKRLLRKAGYSVCSRKSSIPKLCTIGKVRAWIRKQTGRGWYYVSVPHHAMVLDHKGETVVDTAPRKRDARQVVRISVVTTQR